MKISEMKAGLYCTRCHDETIHRVVYVNNSIQSIKCEGCHRVTGMKINAKKELYEEIYNRIATKPSRVTQEYKQDLSRFVSGMPLRMISKPYRLIKYVNETRKVLKEFKHS
ncbi:hypothetical protein [Domibacillus indicus]|uniref:hypothetical protein n=1 Tax=Domibacillus indicus TaxID=1437523 RepID=UPI000617CE46|nr:hypothetical protein [Domibacillus indicus]